MVATERTVEVTPGSEVDRLLDEADKTPLVLTRNGMRYTLQVDDPAAYYDPERLLSGMRAAAGSITEAEADERIANIYRWREEGSRPWRGEDGRSTDRT